MDFPIFENSGEIKLLYHKMLSDVLAKYGLNQIELDVLLFLAHHPENDTAKDITEMRKLTKSHVSGAVESLSKKGYLERRIYPDNRKLIHLILKDTAAEIIRDGEEGQKEFFAVLSKGFSKEELDNLFGYLKRIKENVEKAYGKL